MGYYASSKGLKIIPCSCKLYEAPHFPGARSVLKKHPDTLTRVMAQTDEVVRKSANKKVDRVDYSVTS